MWHWDGNDTFYCEDDNTVASGRCVNVCVCVSDEFEPRFMFNLDISAQAKIRKMRLGENEDTKPTRRENPGGSGLAPAVSLHSPACKHRRMHTPRGPQDGQATGSPRSNYSELL